MTRDQLELVSLKIKSQAVIDAEKRFPKKLVYKDVLKTLDDAVGKETVLSSEESMSLIYAYTNDYNRKQAEMSANGK